MIARHKIMDKILWISLGLLVLFAWFDSQNLIGIKQIDTAWQAAGGWDASLNVWTIFWGQISPAVFNLWIGVLAAIGLIWYVISKDKSESLALFLTPATLIWFGVQDLIYFVFSPDVFTESIGCWADALQPVRIISDLLGETCPTTTSFMLSAILGGFLAYWIYKKLKEAKW
jgi:hypothetical protein